MLTPCTAAVGLTRNSGAAAFRTEWEVVMDLIFDLYWSFRSPYSYIILPRIIELRDGTVRLSALS
jgi:2-hydroxychromene-2-carboxylate isomerase